eukprot:Colp12_sorted_trinity150504_noHs@32340
MSEGIKIPTRTEFAVRMSSEEDAAKIAELLRKRGEQTFEINWKRQQVIVESSSPLSEVKETLGQLGHTVVLRGQGALGGKNLGAAVCLLETNPAIQGMVRFVQVSEDVCVVDGTADGLSPGLHGVHVHEYGDLSGGGDTCGGHYSVTGTRHGAPGESSCHEGDLGNMEVDTSGRGTLLVEARGLKVWDIIGRSLCIKAEPDDLGRGSGADSSVTGGARTVVACGIIARAAGVFENQKKVCACSGRTLWEDTRFN